MNNFFRALIAGAAAKKFGGGCLGTILIFVLVWVALGQCGNSSPRFKKFQSSIKEKQVKTTFIHPEMDRPFWKLPVESIQAQTQVYLQTNKEDVDYQ